MKEEGYVLFSYQKVSKFWFAKSASTLKTRSKWLGLLLVLKALVSPSYAINPLPVDQVFQVVVKPLSSESVEARWAIKPGYYLYRDKIHFQSKQAKIKAVVLPNGLAKHNKFLGDYQVYQHHATAVIKFTKPIPAHLPLTIEYQGCAAAGFCYPPVKKTIQVVTSVPKKQNKTASPSSPPVKAALVAAAAPTPAAAVANSKASSPASSATATKKTVHQQLTEDMSGEQSKAMKLLAGHNLGLILIGFFGFGLLLSFTPCVLPLIPILSAIILGQKQLNTTKAFTLSLTYVLAMALTYAIAGVFAGLAGSYLQAFLQNPWVISVVSLLFVLLAFSLFGLYDLRLPTRWHDKLTELTNRQKGGNYLSVALMGALSTLVISPCITAPLVGVLTYIGNSGSPVLGGFSLFILGVGSGIPLLIIGTSAGKWLPKSGRWMNWVKIVLGVMMLMMAGWLLLRVIPVNAKSFYLTKSTQTTSSDSGIQVEAIKSIPGLNQALLKAKQKNKLVLLDFYADWCLSCKEMEHIVFPKLYVKRFLSRFIVLRVDVTTNDGSSKAIEKRFNVIAPPTFIFLNPEGQEIHNTRIVGQMGPQAFAAHLKGVLAAKRPHSPK